MTINEAIEAIRKDGEWTEANLSVLGEAVSESDFKDFTDPNLKSFMDFIYEYPYHEKIQDMVTSIMIKFMEKGVASPCGGGCGACAFHDLEFGHA